MLKNVDFIGKNNDKIVFLFFGSVLLALSKSLCILQSVKRTRQLDKAVERNVLHSPIDKGLIEYFQF